MTGPRRLDWRGLMETGLGRLRLPPEAFWAMTPRELSAACAGAFGTGRSAADAGSLRALMAQFPDAASAKQEDAT
ncbi:rcc01693 family protein [Rubrimonas cliftonensis]|uniref:Phage tail assembly chaperone protein, TAC n=1 Tax=Rubrimonas cliftonensis TaxID=89524 RepID=A0A1H3ZHE4_9RHOB|nr:rcc01693 family protein [Rubrimonas cliftonensis]SEA22968.1 phage conserved hypothetical protein [Rubrimonas cliftonensis]